MIVGRVGGWKFIREDLSRLQTTIGRIVVGIIVVQKWLTVDQANREGRTAGIIHFAGVASTAAVIIFFFFMNELHSRSLSPWCSATRPYATPGTFVFVKAGGSDEL